MLINGETPAISTYPFNSTSLMIISVVVGDIVTNKYLAIDTEVKYTDQNGDTIIGIVKSYNSIYDTTNNKIVEVPIGSQIQELETYTTGITIEIEIGEGNNSNILYDATDIQINSSITNADGFLNSSETDIVVYGQSSILLTPQSGVIDGLTFYWHENIIVNIEAGDSEPRLDLVVLEKNQSLGTTEVKVKKGTPSISPTLPSITQTTLGYYELPIMSIYVNASQTVLSREYITDLRNPTSKEQIVLNSDNITTLYNNLIGVALPFAGKSSQVPDNAVILAGQNISRTEYPITFTRLGTFWGIGDGSTTFTLPDGRNKAFYATGTDSTNNTYTELAASVGGYLKTTIINATGTCLIKNNRSLTPEYSGVLMLDSLGTTASNTGSNASSELYLDLSRQVPTGSTNKPNMFVGNWIMFLG